MIFLINIPHQRPATLASFSDESEAIDAACEASEQTVGEYPNTFDDAIAILSDDMHGHILIRSMDDLDSVAEYNGHQQHKVRAMAPGIEDILISEVASR